MNTEILEDIPFKVDLDSLKRRLRIRESDRMLSLLQTLVGEAENVARPKAMVRAAYINDRSQEAIEVEGQWFRSRVLAVNVSQAHRLFIYVATCGKELEQWSRERKGTLEIFWADALKEIALRQAVKAVGVYLEEQYHPGRTAHQNPGSLEDFPLPEQEALFALLGDTEAGIGVTLLPSLMMSPSHSISGIIFPTNEDFQSCLLCPREKCPGRRAPYDPSLYSRKYSLLRETLGQ
ncbi:MAG: vitamin B12 dependent methionine synthase [Thermodesulfobacteriota bacterium]